MIKLVSMAMLLGLIAVEIVGFTRWIGPSDHERQDQADIVQVAVHNPAR